MGTPPQWNKDGSEVASVEQEVQYQAESKMREQRRVQRYSLRVQRYSLLFKGTKVLFTIQFEQCLLLCVNKSLTMKSENLSEGAKQGTEHWENTDVLLHGVNSVRSDRSDHRINNSVKP